MDDTEDQGEGGFLSNDDAFNTFLVAHAQKENNGPVRMMPTWQAFWALLWTPIRIAMALSGMAFWLLLIYVAIHFAIKYW